MDRVLIIGNSGSGKTTFAKALAKQTALPLVHLDQLYWCGNWEHLPREDFDRLLQPELEKSRWIIDGNFNRTIPHRLKYCDTVIFFDFPTLPCLWGITKRILTNYGRTREDMGGSCVERFDLQKLPLYRSTWTFRKRNRSAYYALLSQCDATVIVLRNRRQAKAFLNQRKAASHTEAPKAPLLGRGAGIAAGND